MIERIILHAGLPKTGTSALQERLAANRAALAAHGIAYPEAFAGANQPHPNHRFLTQELRRDPSLPRTRAALAAAEAAGLHRVIFSIEDLTGHATQIRPEAAAAFREAAGQARLEILVVTREPQAWLASMYRQSIMNPRLERADISPLEATYATDRRFADFAADPALRRICDPESIARLYEGLFPEAELQFLPYDREVVDRILHLLGVEGMLDTPAEARSNLSPEDACLELLRQMNGHLGSGAALDLCRALISAEMNHAHGQLALYRAPRGLPARILAARRLLAALSRTVPPDNPPLAVDPARFAALRDRLRAAARRSLWGGPDGRAS